MEDTDTEVMVDTVMERDLLMLSPVMDMELVMVLPPPLTIHMVVQAPPTEAPRDFLDTAMVLTDMEREMLSPVMDTELVTVLPPPLTIHMEVPALPTEAPRDFLDTDMVVTDMERDLLSPVTDMEADTLSSPKAVHTTMVPMDITLTTLMARDPPSPVMDMLVMDTEVPTAASMSQDLTPTMALMLPTLTKKTVRDRKMYLQTNVASIHLMYLLNRFK